MLVHDCTTSMQDGAPCHSSKIARDFFGSNKTTFMKRPGNSSKFNPIENFWIILEDKVAEKSLPNIFSLIEAIKLVWIRKIPDEFCKYLTKRKPR